MARLNIEDEIERDERFRALIRKLGEDPARGMLWRFWAVAQTYWGRGELVPEDIFDLGGFGPILDVKLAEKRDGGYYAKGSEERFSWYRKRREAASAGGRASVESRRKGGGTAQPKQTRTNPEAKGGVDRSESEANPNPLSLSLTHTLTQNTHTHTGAAALVEIWNAEKATSMPSVTKLTPGKPRHKAATARLREEPDLERWREVVRRIAASSFCNGGGSTGWVADFDFLVRPETFAKVFEGKYDDRKPQAPPQARKPSRYPLITFDDDKEPK